MTRIVYNSSYGGFSLSRAAWRRMCELRGVEFVPNTCFMTKGPVEEGSLFDSYGRDTPRTDPHLLQVIDEMGCDAASSKLASLAVEELPAGTIYRIDEYDGAESVMRQSDYEWSVA